jgi:Raf kinase inhibitor-like YbhB/YbcL family protein
MNQITADRVESASQEKVMAQGHHSSGEDVVFHKVTPRDQGRMELVSSAIDDSGRILDRFTAYHDNISPPLSWTQVLDAEAYALIVEDPDAPTERPYVHWMIWNIPGAASSLPPGLPSRPRLDHPKGAIQGRNSKGGVGYFGPWPPAGHGPHRYHFQLFALDKLLPMDSHTPLPELLNALKGNTIAKSELVGTYEAPQRQ